MVTPDGIRRGRQQNQLQEVNIQKTNHKKVMFDWNFCMCSFLTPASRPVWLQLMKKVRPKQEVELIRKNMLLYRLSADRILPPGLGEVITRLI